MGTMPGDALAERHCAPSAAGARPLERAAAERLLAALAPGWRLGADATSLHHDFRFRDFHRTMSFVNCVAHIANVEDHHPELAVGYGHLHVTWTTHSVKGLSENDFICAAKIDRIPSAPAP